MDFCMKRMYIKSNWFDEGNNKYQRIGIDGFNLYINLFRFRLFNQEHEYTFITSISLLRKETKYSSHRIFELLKQLAKEKVIKLNISRWDRLMDENGKIDTDKTIIIIATDKPAESRRDNDTGEISGAPLTSEDHYISLDLPLIQYYKNLGLGERYLGLYCLLNRYSNNAEGKSWMSINKMAGILGFGYKSVHDMIREMNRRYLLYSRYVKSDEQVLKDGRTGTKFEHYLLTNLGYKEEFVRSHKDLIDKNIKKWDKE